MAFFGLTVGVSLQAAEAADLQGFDIGDPAPMSLPASAGFVRFRFRVFGTPTVSRTGSVQGTGFLMNIFLPFHGAPRSVISTMEVRWPGGVSAGRVFGRIRNGAVASQAPAMEQRRPTGPEVAQGRRLQDLHRGICGIR